ncbi:MAG: hypothetical protein K8R17_06170 [Methanosarcinales archaeon]|nr:hypothetical protein [Methanosarcinales archaeon]
MKLKYFIMISVSVLMVVLMINSGLCQMGGPMRDDMGRRFGENFSAGDMMGAGQTLRQDAGMQGMGFMHSGACLYGQYITFDVDNLTGEITNYGIAGVEIFDSIAVNGFEYDSTQVSEAITLTTIADTDGTTFIQVHDNPAAVINVFSSEDYTVNFDLADGTTVSEEENIVKIEVEGSDIVVYIISASVGTIDISGDNGPISITSPADSSVVVRAVPVNMQGQGLDNVHGMFVREMAGNRVGAEVSLGKGGSMSVVNYAEEMHVELQSMTQDMIRLRVNSTDPAGRIMAFNLDNTSLMLREMDRIGIHYDGTPMACVNDPGLVFNATTATCWISQQTREQAQIMMYIPEFSEHTIDIVVESDEAAEVPTTTETPETPDTKVPGFEALIAVLGLVLSGYVSKKLKK